MESISFAAEMRAGGVLFVYNKEKMQRPQLYLIVMHGLEGGGAADMASGGRWLCPLLRILRDLTEKLQPAKAGQFLYRFCVFYAA